MRNSHSDIRKFAPIFIWISLFLQIGPAILSASQKTPKEPAGVKGTLTLDISTFTITWSAVTKNTDGSTITDLTGYNIYRTNSVSDLGTGAPFIQVTSHTTSVTDTTIGGAKFFYTIRSINTSFVTGDTTGTISINSLVVHSGSDQTVLIVPSEEELVGRIEITIPEAAKSVLEKDNNSFGEDLRPVLKLTEASGLKDAFIGVEFKIRTAESDQDIANFSFDQPVRVSFPYGSLLASRAASGAGAVSTPDEIAVFWNNGVEWLNLGGVVDTSDGTVSARSRHVGEFGTRRVSRVSQFKIFSITPRKIFTPNGDGCNDLISIQFQNPEGISGIIGRVYDLRGALIARMKTSSSFGTFSFDSTCPRPNLADDTLIWDGKDSDGNLVRKGIYIYQIDAGNKAFNGTVVVAR